MSKTMKTLAYPELRDKAMLIYGEECQKKAMELMETFGLPGGLLQLEGIVESGWVEETGFVWIITKEKQEHYFKKADRHCAYREEVSCYIEKNRMRNIKGVKCKELFTWVPVNEAYINESNPTKIHMKSIAGIYRSFPTHYFAKEVV